MRGSVTIQSSLSSFFVLVIAGIMIIAMLVNTGIQYQSFRQADVEKLNAEAESLARLLSEISIAPLLSYDYVTLSGYTKDTQSQQHLIYALIETAEGKILTAYLDRNEEVLHGLNGMNNILGDDQQVIQQLQKSDVDILHTRVPIRFEDQLLGHVQIGMDKRHIEGMARNHMVHQFIISGFIAGIIAIVLIVTFRRKISSRLRSLMEGAERVSNFEFDYKLDTTGSDELSVLAETFNNMTEQLKVTVEERDLAFRSVEQQKLTLEERVAERSKELQSLNKALSYQALHDPLTGLPNRVLILDRLQSAMLRAKRNKKNTAIFMLDLDKFKDINDTLGHPVGDRLLQAIGRRLKGAIREEDTIGRLGGDEFAVVLPDTSLEKTYLVAHKLLSVFGPQFNIDDYKLSISASLGIAMYPEHGDDQATLLKRADVAMYVAKGQESRIALYDPEKDQYSPARLEMITALRSAVDHNDIWVAYQPIISLKTGKVEALEALARWQFAGQSISPDEFIPIVEESGLGQRFSTSVLKQVIEQISGWKVRNISLPVSVNMSLRNLDQLNLPELIGGMLNETNLGGEALKIEITENELMANPEYLMNLIQHPALEGVQYSIDDFGTGYSSLSYLKKLSVHQVKIDRSFVTDIDKNSEDYAIAKAIIDLSHSLGLEVVAEGVESVEALTSLVGLGCDYVQGFLFAQPMLGDELISSIITINKQASVLLTSHKRKNLA